MFKRSDLKMRAKAELKISYWISFLVALLGGIICGFSSNINVQINTPINQEQINRLSEELTRGNSGAVVEFLNSYAESYAAAAISIAAVVLSLLVLAYTFFVANPVGVGMASFFSRAPYGNRDFNLLFSSFKGNRYLKIVKTMFVQNIYLVLWSLLLVVPGIIKSYSYRMVPYIIADNPELSPNEAITASRNMMRGHKWFAFVLDLSWIGWSLLCILIGCLTCGIGLLSLLFLEPYILSTNAQLYLMLKEQQR